MFRSKDVSSTFRHNNKRKSMSRKRDPKVFSSTADRSRVENSPRGGLHRGGERM